MSTADRAGALTDDDVPRGLAHFRARLGKGEIRSSRVPRTARGATMVMSRGAAQFDVTQPHPFLRSGSDGVGEGGGEWVHALLRVCWDRQPAPTRANTSACGDARPTRPRPRGTCTPFPLLATRDARRSDHDRPAHPGHPEGIVHAPESADHDHDSVPAPIPTAPQSRRALTYTADQLRAVPPPRDPPRPSTSPRSATSPPLRPPSLRPPRRGSSRPPRRAAVLASHRKRGDGHEHEHATQPAAQPPTRPVTPTVPVPVPASLSSSAAAAASVRRG